jgi:uncharacterized membrane-anchored protein
MNKKIAFYVAVALQLVVLGWMVAAKERALLTGARVVLPVQPIDPMDYMSGRYIAISPAIALIDTTKTPLFRGDTGDGSDPATAFAPLTDRYVFVELEQSGEVWTASRVVVEGAGVPPHQPFLRARVNSHDGALLRLDYSLNRFFIPADGHDPSFLVSDPAHTVRVVVRAPTDGAGVVEDLLVDGKPWKEWDAEERAKAK